MFVRNLLQAGDRVTIIPIGVRITLQYGVNGQIERVYSGFEDDKILRPELLSPLITSKEIPTHIPITNGTTFVYGCLYTGESYAVEGKVPDDLETLYISKYLEDRSKFHFFAGHMQSLAFGMNSPVAIQRWLQSSGFKILISYLVPQGLKEENFASLINLHTYPFAFPRISGYIIYRLNKYEFVSTNIRQLVVKNLSKRISYEGYILAELESTRFNTLSVSYADVINFNIHEGSVVLINEANQVIDVVNLPGTKFDPYTSAIKCDYCGRLINVPSASVKFKCSDEHCSSNMYSRVSRMLSKLGFATVERSAFDEYSKCMNHVVNISDVLDMDCYADCVVNVNLPNLLEAIVPSTIVSQLSDWVTFCNKCNNSVETVMYYIQNPENIISDLGLSSVLYSKLVTWLQSPENVLDVTDMITNSHVKITSIQRRFNGAPIFRNKSIYITGKFLHGSSDDIEAILSSYSATVYNKFNTAVDCVIIGETHENVDGKSIQRAKQMQIPIFEESEFFQKYEIDSDLKQYHA